MADGLIVRPKLRSPAKNRAPIGELVAAVRLASGLFGVGGLTSLSFGVTMSSLIIGSFEMGTLYGWCTRRSLLGVELGET